VEVAFHLLAADAPQQLMQQIFYGVFAMQISRTACGSPSKPPNQIQSSTTSLPISERMFLRAKGGADYLSISKSHFHALVRDGVLPQGRMISQAVRVWKRTSLKSAAEQMWGEV
jgi:predicted DNA-binding transcriptional regulator AlpA